MGNWIETIMSNLKLQDVVERYIPHLRDKRIDYKYICPFHEDKNPSMTIKGNRFHCFGCGADGRLIDFVKLYFKVDCKQALQILSKDFNISLENGTMMFDKIQETKKNREIEKRINELEESCLNQFKNIVNIILTQLEIIEYQTRPYNNKNLGNYCYTTDCENNMLALANLPYFYELDKILSNRDKEIKKRFLNYYIKDGFESIKNELIWVI